MLRFWQNIMYTKKISSFNFVSNAFHSKFLESDKKFHAFPNRKSHSYDHPSKNPTQTFLHTENPKISPKSLNTSAGRARRHEDAAIFHRLMGNGTQLDDSFAFLLLSPLFRTHTHTQRTSFFRWRDETAQLSNSPR